MGSLCGSWFNPPLLADGRWFRPSRWSRRTLTSSRLFIREPEAQRPHRPVSTVAGHPLSEAALVQRCQGRLKLPYALGISSTLTVFRGTPPVAVPPKTPGRSRPPSRLHITDGTRPEAVRLIAAALPAKAWRPS